MTIPHGQHECPWCDDCDKWKSLCKELAKALENSKSDTCELHCSRTKHGIDCQQNTQALSNWKEAVKP